MSESTFALLFRPQDEGDVFLWNGGRCLSQYKAKYPTRHNGDVFLRNVNGDVYT
jgi:hypothetical protein